MARDGVGLLQVFKYPQHSGSTGLWHGLDVPALKPYLSETHVTAGDGAVLQCCGNNRAASRAVQ